MFSTDFFSLLYFFLPIKWYQLLIQFAQLVVRIEKCDDYKNVVLYNTIYSIYSSNFKLLMMGFVNEENQRKNKEKKNYIDDLIYSVRYLMFVVTC